MNLNDVAATLRRFPQYVAFFNGSIHLYPFTRKTPLYVTVKLSLNESVPFCTFVDVVGVGRRNEVSREELHLDHLRVPISLDSLNRLVRLAAGLADTSWSYTRGQKGDAAFMMPIIKRALEQAFSR